MEVNAAFAFFGNTFAYLVMSANPALTMYFHHDS